MDTFSWQQKLWREPPHVCDKIASKPPGTRVVLGYGELWKGARRIPMPLGNGNTILFHEEAGFTPGVHSEIVTREEWLRRCDERKAIGNE